MPACVHTCCRDAFGDRSASPFSTNVLRVQLASPSLPQPKRWEHGGGCPGSPGDQALLLIIFSSSHLPSPPPLQPKRWDAEEEAALVRLVKKHGRGNWALILREGQQAGEFHEGRKQVRAALCIHALVCCCY